LCFVTIIDPKTNSDDMNMVAADRKDESDASSGNYLEIIFHL